MKRVKIEPVRTILGKPFRITDIEARVRDGEEPRMIEDAGLVDILKLLIFSIPRQKFTMQDSIHAKDFMDAGREVQDGVLILSDGVYDWLKRVVEDHAPMAYGPNAYPIKVAIENVVRRPDKVERKAGAKSEESEKEQ